MVWGIVIVLVAGPLLALAVVAAPLLRRLGEVGVTARRLRLHLVEAQRLVPAVTALQHRVELLRDELLAVQAKVARTRGVRQPSGPLTKLSDG
ncbi:hypothetical protein HC031_20970 [Planosporangium thailandense]|uniref:Uncharacterized protein n=1 Tax=Planosporangium thailandense TaxID=765197 RepID=A0ABX0Y434_9ACTN|nr:hypothetical protein [Planosporangium thailandense]NJC72170.1 hypothetical protein [Planosporangium thailandense]